MRRLFDIGIALLGLALLLPAMLLAAFAIFVQSGRPIIFSQKRIGQGGHPFWMYKFRKFHRDCGSDGCPLTLQGDERLTSVGRVLQATKLDELPQLWNVLKGDMAIVGPRPESLPFADCYEGDFKCILAHRPGIMGPSQVMFREESAYYPDDTPPSRFYREVLFPIKASIDLSYYSRRNLATDILWLARGVMAVFLPPRSAPAQLARAHLSRTK